MSIPQLSPSSDPEQLFLDSLALIDRILAIQARRAGLDWDDAQEYASWAKARLIENDYSIIRAFGGRSLFATYLNTVLHNLSRDYRNARWGRWRPSAAALRAGLVGTRLEQLLFRDRRSLRETIQIMRAEGCELSDREIARLAARLQHVDRKDVPLDEAANVAGTPSTSPERSIERDAARAIERALEEVLTTLPAEDVLIIRMRHWSGLSVADIARTLNIDQKRLYRRLEALHAQLRVLLEARGIGKDAIADLFDRSTES